MNDELEPYGYTHLRCAIQSGDDPLQAFFLIVAQRGFVGSAVADAARYLQECYRVARLFVTIESTGLDRELLSFVRADSDRQRSFLELLWRVQQFPDYLVRVGLLGYAASEYVKRYGAKGLP
jgi:hypothetical protein